MGINGTIIIEMLPIKKVNISYAHTASMSAKLANAKNDSMTLC